MATEHYSTAKSQQQQHQPLSSQTSDDITRDDSRIYASHPTSHPAQRGPTGGSVAPSSRDLQDVPQSRGTSPRPPPSPFHDRLDPPVTSPLTSPVITMETKKSQPGAPQQVQGRRKGGGGGGQQQLRSPVVKRPAAAPVTLQGWLHKQGSEGLMLWKRRWFVLSEYCLFYYKGPEEEKLLGSILLPSYKISPCSTEDRVYRKFAFKAEHINMRTYHFAADTREFMVRWMNALSLASILQEGSSWDDHRSARPSVVSISSMLKQSADESDSGFHGYRPPHSVTVGTPSTVPASSSSKLSSEQISKNEDASRQLNTSNDSVFTNGLGLQKQGAGCHQPLYANAPPKPRRLAEHEDYGASSPEPASDRQAEELAGKKTLQDPEGIKGFVPRIAQPQQPSRNERMDVRYHYHQAAGQKSVHSCEQPLQQEQLQRLQQPAQQGLGSYGQVLINVERRTPDTYGRSNSATPGSTGQNKVTRFKGGDYEDVYNISDTVRHSGSEGSYREVNKQSSCQVAYIKGAGPVISIHHKQNYSERGHGDNRSLPQGGGQYSGHSAQHQQNYAVERYASSIPSQQPDVRAPNMYSAHVQQQPLPNHRHNIQLVRHREAQPNRYPPRPHSADFLDYDAKRHNRHYSCQPLCSPGQEASRSRDFLQHGAGGDDKNYQEQYASRVARIPRPKSSLEMLPPPNPGVSDNYYWSEERYAQKMRQSASYVHQIPMTHPRNQSSSSRATTPSIRLSTPSGGSAQVGGVSSGGSVNSEIAGVVLRHPKRTDLMPSYAMTIRSPSGQQYQQQRRWSEHRDTSSDGQFTRSASARLPRQRYQDDENDSRCEEQWQKSASDVHDGEKKIQQREESMKRLLEWKQRMLQSPLTRKPSGSSTRGVAQNELSKYYKQQVLRELASQEARSRDVTNSQDGRVSSKRRSQMEDTGTVPGRSMIRSRSQDGRRSSTSLSRYNSYSSDDEASGSGSVIGRDPLPPRAVSAASLQQQVKDTPPPTITLTSEDSPQAHSAPNSLSRKTSPSSGGMSHPSVPGSPNSAGNMERSDALDGQGKRNRVGGGGGGSNSGGSGPWGINVSAGELLGRTHEELVLLLIQLRRQSAGVCKAMETCHFEIEAQARLSELEVPKRLEHLQKLDELKRHLLDLEKQYEKGKPLVNLVDNMVKLGSLYRGSGVSLHSGTGGPGDVHSVRERLQFNQKVQEQRLLAEERRDWDRVSPDRGQLQAKVQELYRLDRLLQEESGTLQSLQQDKELLEKALGGLRHKLQGSRASPAEAERYRKQQRLLEKELSRIRLLLAHNSKKLEETVAENARLEQELVVLRQKLQASRRGSQQRPAVALIADSVSTSTTAALEAELRRVQQLVGDLQRQRQELSIQVRHLTEKSHSLVQQIRPGPTGVAGAGPIPGRKRHHSTWLETDLDSLVTLDHGLDSPASPQHQISPPGSKIQPPAPPVDSIAQTPLYVNTDASSMRTADQNIYKGSLVDGEDLVPPPLPAPPELPPDYPPPPPPPPSEEAMMNGGNGQQCCTHMDISEADDRMKRFYGIIPREKQQEIKTVRIVKRESERRQRDRDRSGNIGIPITNGTTGGKRVTIVEDGDTGTSQYPVEKQQLGCVLEEEPQDKQFSEEMMAPEEDPVLAQFQRSMSLPRGFGKREQLGYQQQQVVPPLPPVRVPSPRSDSVTVLRNLMINRHRVRFESYSGGSSSSAESTSSQRAVSPSLNPSRSLTAHQLLFGVSHDDPISHHYAITSPGSSDVSPQLSPVFKSEAARAIVMEMSSMRDSTGHNVEHQPRRRAVPKEKRRHHTVSSSQPLLGIETTASPIMGSARSRDDLDMERALRPRLNAPDVVRSTMSHKDFKYNENTIDSILGTPNKIVIPERYIPEQAPELSAEEQMHRLKKAEAIRKMLSETTSITASDSKEKEEEKQTSTLKKKVAAEKKEREHLLQLNQILAKQVMEKSKMVAGSTSVPSLE